MTTLVASTHKSLPEMIRAATGREHAIEDVVEALAHAGAFDFALPPGTARDHVRRGAHRCADVELRNAEGQGLLGLEVKITSQINHDADGHSQFAHMRKRTPRLFIVTSERGARRPNIAEIGATIMTLAELGDIAEKAGISTHDVIRVSLGV